MIVNEKSLNKINSLRLYGNRGETDDVLHTKKEKHSVRSAFLMYKVAKMKFFAGCDMDLRFRVFSTVCGGGRVLSYRKGFVLQ